jgi:Cu+-exporting ATPase
MHNSSCCGGEEKDKDCCNGEDKSCCGGGKTSDGMVTDVVCGMKVDPKETKVQSEHKGKVYYFCNIGCKEKFESDPEKYLAKSN